MKSERKREDMHLLPLWSGRWYYHYAVAPEEYRGKPSGIFPAGTAESLQLFLLNA